MNKLKILLYGDIDMNLIDGSSIWITSIINTLLTNENIKIDFLLKSSIKDNTVISSIENLKNLNVINPFENTKFRGIRMQPDEAAEYIELLDKENKYDCIIVRGNILCESVCKKEKLVNKLMTYIVIQGNSKNIDNISIDEINRLKFIYNNSRYTISQTKESKDTLKKLLNINTDDKFIIIPPMIPNLSKNTPDFLNKTNTLIYSGKFCDNWNTEKILKACEKLIQEDASIYLTFAGNKFHKDIMHKKQEIINKLIKNNNINWLQGVSREDSNKAMKDSDIGIAWRSRLIDNDDSIELSTKVLEYARAGIPVILNRTKLHENLLGKDYPLFVENTENEEAEFMNKVKLVLYNEDVYLKAATSAYNAVNKYTFSEIYKSIHLKLWSFKKNKINIVFAGHDFKFIKKFIGYCNDSDKFNIKIDTWIGHSKHDVEYSNECLNWADIIFCEWGLGNAKWYSNNKKEYQKLIVRIHSQERRTQFYKDFDISKIDKVICITPYMFEEIYKIMNIPREKIKMIYNYVDCDYFNKPKLKNCQYNLGIVGICPKSKRLDLAIDIFETLWQKDNRYKLYIKGKHPNEYPWLLKKQEERIYYENIFNKIDKSSWKDNVIFDGFGNDLDEWFRKIGYILSPSDFEGSHVSVAEGIASGSVPIIFNWKGSDTIYPQQNICNSVKEAIDLINKYNYIIESKELKEYSKINFDINKILKDIEDLIKYDS